MKKKVIIFDLDGTLAESKQPLDEEMASLIAEIIQEGYFVAVMSGGSFTQYQKQFLPFLSLSPDQYKNLILMPTSGAAMYTLINNNWREVYTRTIALKDGEEITKVLHQAALITGNIPEHPYGTIIEDRGTQITYSGLGQEAPIEEKRDWDPDQFKRREMVLYVARRLPKYTASIGGTTSIDVTEKGVDKAYGVRQLSERLNIPIEEMIFIGDALFPGGNDEPVRKSGIECVSVASVSETKKAINGLLKKQ